MSQCPNGTQVKSGAPASFWVFDFPFLNWLSSRVPAFAALISALIPPELVITANFCTAEPIIPTAPTLSDYLLAFTPFGNASAIVEYWRAVYKSSVFPDYCQCAPGGTPAGSLEAYIATLNPVNWWKYDDVAGSTSAHDYGTGGQNGGITSTVNAVFNTPKIAPNASGTCLTTNGTALNCDNGGSAALSTKPQLTFVGFFQTTDTSLGPMFTNYHAVQAWIEINKDESAGKLKVHMRDTADVETGAVSTNSDFHNGSTHMFVLRFDHTNNVWSLVTDNNRAECNGTLSSNSYWASGSTLWTHDRFEGGGAAFGGKSQNWFIVDRILTTAEVSNLWFNAGMGGGPAYVPVTPTTPSTIPSSPPGTQSCTSIADLCVLLNTVLAKLNQFMPSSPTLVRSWSLGTVHAGLSGSGVLSVAGLLGVRVELTTVPLGQGWTSDSPRRSVPKVGAIQTRYGSAYRDEFQVHYDHQMIWFTDQLADGIAYSFHFGVVATVTEITRGP